MDENGNTAQQDAEQLTGGASDAAAESSAAAEQGTGTVGESSTANQSFTQADIDKAVETARAEWKKEADEAAELAKLSKEAREKKVFERDKEKFETEKAKFAREKLLLETEKQLSSRKLPTEFAEILTGKDADSTLKSIETFEAAFSKAVEAAVNERLKADPPKIFGGGKAQTDPFLAGFEG